MKPRVWGNEPTPDTPTTRAYPPDVNRDSSSRLPPVRREDLDEAGQRAYDAMTKEGSKLRASLRGPTGFWLHMPEVIEHVRELNFALRNRASGLARPLRELTILVTARANVCAGAQGARPAATGAHDRADVELHDDLGDLRRARSTGRA